MLIFVCLSEVKIPTLVILSVAKYLKPSFVCLRLAKYLKPPFVCLRLAKYLVTQKEILHSLSSLAMTKNQKEIFHWIRKLVKDSRF